MNSKILEIAFSQYGITEIKGSEHNPEVLKYFQDIGHEWVKDDETAWCSAFANWVAMKAGCERSKKLNARSWLDVGENIYHPMLGDIVVLWRDDITSWKGHVAFYINYIKDEKYIYLLGGNQGNKVCIQAYPIGRVISYKRLAPIR